MLQAQGLLSSGVQGVSVSSKQDITATIPTGSTTAVTVAITPIDTDKAVLMHMGSLSGLGAATQIPHAHLKTVVDGQYTEIEFKSESGPVSTTFPRVVLLEMQNLKSVNYYDQLGTYNGDVTITAVDTDKSFVTYCGGGGPTVQFEKLEITTATNVRIDGMAGRFGVVEMY